MSGTSLSAVVLCLLLAPPSGAAPQDQRALMPPELRGSGVRAEPDAARQALSSDAGERNGAG
jgi:hypothetical protein